MNWALPANWSHATLPNGPGVQAVFASTAALPQTIALDENTTAGIIRFSSATTAYTLVPGINGTLTLDNAGAAATISVTAGNHTTSSPIALTSAGVVIDVAANSSLSLTAPLSNGSLTKSSAGKIALSANSRRTCLTISAGTLDKRASSL